MSRILIPLAVFLNGGAVMVVEILGVRMISPVFGTGMHVWASLISVALVALAAGYFAGGWLADRHPSRRLFYLLVVAGGIGVVLLPRYAFYLIPVFEPLGYRIGALCAAVVTFLPPLFLIGCSSPFAVRILTFDVQRVGRVAGRLFALGTLGSVAGTLLAGFFLAPVLEIGVTLSLVGVVLVLPGLVGLAKHARLRGTLPPLLVLLCVIWIPTAEMASARGVQIWNTPFQQVKVFDRDGERWLLLDGCVHTHMEVGVSPWCDWGYIPLFRFLPGYRPGAKSLLVLGLGGGAVLPLFEAEEYEVTAVEIDPVVVRVARESFGTLTGAETVHVADARPFVRRAGRTWDLVVLDVCGSDRQPEHLSTVEFFREVKRVLTPEGVVAMNAIGPVDGRTLASLQRTLSEVFARVVPLALNPEGPLTNVVFYASDGPLTLSDLMDLDAEQHHVSLPPGFLLTDQWNPINYWNARWAREIRRTHSERY